jgi:hypothetical protein
MKTVTLLLTIALAGCEFDAPAADQCMRREIFTECLKIVPAGPTKTHYNDWAEVIGKCENAAYYQSLRKTTQIKPECRS